MMKKETLKGLCSLTDRIKDFLRVYTDDPPSNPPQDRDNDLEDLPFSLKQLSNLFRLSPFERDVILLCLGMELDPEFELLCAQVQLNKQRFYPSLGLALSVLPNPDFQVLSKTSPLHYWQLINIGESLTFNHAPIRLDQRILCYLLDQNTLDEELIGFVNNFPDHLQPMPLTYTYKNLIDQLLLLWSSTDTQLPILQLWGYDLKIKYQIAAFISQQLNQPIKVILGTAIPPKPQECFYLQKRLTRECLLTNSVIFLDCDDLQEMSQFLTITQFIENLSIPFIISSQTRIKTRHRPLISFDIPPLSYEEQKALWLTHLGSLNQELNGQIITLASQFNLNPDTIKTACLQVKNNPDQNNSIPQQLWNFCRTQARPCLEDLAQRIETNTNWDDLILPEPEKATLKEITAHLRQRGQVYEEWGFAGKERRGLGISALFSGQSGTGKTMAAGVLARALNLDLYRIDLSAVVSKYIGETEKNLRKIFDAAETGGAVLLFDEADALFGKRTEVKDSHDRHANVEVSYLLQRMEAYQGLAILTTNLKNALDTAFMRRIRFFVHFPFPDPEAREEIWKRIFPDKTPTQDLNFKKLSYLSVAGGNIRNIALNAAMLAADADEPVMMKHLLQATRNEYQKLEKPLSDSEVRNWIQS